MSKNNFEWCEPPTQIKDVKTGIDAILRVSYTVKVSGKDGCLRWVCQCRHDKGSHRDGVKCMRCVCKEFEYLNNNNCNIECSIQRKIYEVV